MKPFCFVLMPFGIKNDGKKEINFDKVYEKFIRPAIIAAGLDPIRADEEKTGGFIHKHMYERLMFCEFAIADISFANANVFYELGIRHALKPYTTINIFESGTKLPFDTAPLRSFSYKYENDDIINLDAQVQTLSDLIKDNLITEQALHDSPISQLIKGYQFPDLAYLRLDADIFSTTVQKTNQLKDAISTCVKKWKQLEKNRGNATSDELKHIESEQQAAVNSIAEIQLEHKSTLKYNYQLVYTLLDAYKATNSFKQLVQLLHPLVNISYNDNEPSYKNNLYVQQQLALAYNKTGDRESSRALLEKLIRKFGADPETNGLLGAVYKGLMDDYSNDMDMKEHFCSLAINTYLEGFNADPRDYYPGINALTLLFFSGNKDSIKFQKYLPLVTYAVERQLDHRSNDYWLQATALELAILNDDQTNARKNLSAALACMPDKYQKISTHSNLLKIYNVLYKQSGETEWLKDLLAKLS